MQRLSGSLRQSRQGIRKRLMRLSVPRWPSCRPCFRSSTGICRRSVYLAYRLELARAQEEDSDVRATLLVVALAMLTVSCSKDAEFAKQEYLKSGDRYVAEKKYREAVVQ